ncbi:radical SAM protein [Vibrio furnissii]|uniref:radical SAM protein n=1 Tax=Vibrio furnissii TaxID=29494 RepID=UPI001EEB11A1|nr:radical SAM protein [Vibrio furnissii]MCG6232867.1 radical SAM protein [Vibrio furnissii]MCG6259630.1 radical SAM protein [Vibrio furnissii]
MHYTGPVIRPPHEANSILLEVTVGCTHNSCRFCTFYYDTPYRIAPKKQVEHDLQEAQRVNPNAKRIYAVGGAPFTLRTAKLVDLARMIRRYFPTINIGMYARVDSMFNKDVDDLKQLKVEGINDLVIGIESGDDDVLAQMDKGYTSADILRECQKLEQAGIAYRVIFLGGLAGKGNGERNARHTAQVLNQLHPTHMYMTSVAVQPESLLYQDILEGRFVESSEQERIEETLSLIEQLTNPMVLLGQSVANPVNFIATLPDDYEPLAQMLKTTIHRFTHQDERSLRAYRESLINI